MSFKVRIANLEARLHPRPDPSHRHREHALACR
jgi:hypothetical protein